MNSAPCASSARESVRCPSPHPATIRRVPTVEPVAPSSHLGRSISLYDLSDLLRHRRFVHPVLLNRQIAQLGGTATFVMLKTDVGYEGFNDVDLLLWRNDQQLQVELPKQPQAIQRRLIRAPAKRLVDHHKAERARAHRPPFQSELIGQTGGEDGVGQLFLLAARLAAGIRVVLVLGVVFAPALAGGEQEPVAHVDDLRCPPSVQFRHPLAATETINDGLYLKELGFRILSVVRTSDRSFGASTQFLMEFTDLRIGTRLQLQHDVAAEVEVDLTERLDDVGNAIFDGLALAGQLCVEIGDLVIGSNVEQFLIPGDEARQVVAVQQCQQILVLKGCFEAGVYLGGFELECVLEGDHGLDDLLG